MSSPGRRCPATGGTQGPLHHVRSGNHSEDFLPALNSSQGTVGYDMEVRATLQDYASPDHHWPTAKPVNAGWCYRQHSSPKRLQTLWDLSHVLSVNLFSSGCRWRTCQFWCFLANANRAARCWAVSTGPTRGCRALMHPHGVCFWQFDQKHAHL